LADFHKNGNIKWNTGIRQVQAVLINADGRTDWRTTWCHFTRR